MAQHRAGLLAYVALLALMTGALGQEGVVDTAALEQAKQALQADVARLEAELASATERHNALQASHNTLQAELTAAKQAGEGAASQHAALQASYNHLEQQLAGAQRAQEEVAAKHGALEASYRQLQDRVTAADATKDALQARNAELLAQAESMRGVEGQSAELQARLAELEAAWLPLWLQIAVQEATVRSKAAADIAAEKTKELYAQGVALGAEYIAKARESTVVADMQDKAANYSRVSMEKSKEGLALLQAQWLVAKTKLEPLMAKVSSHAAQIHTELTQFLQPKMAASAMLRPYSDIDTVRMVVTAMMVSPFVALAFPVLLGLVSCVCRSSPKASSAAPPKASKKPGASASSKKSKTRDVKSPVQHGQDAFVAVGGDRVKYGKPVKM